jgi:hypothetical protein
MILLTDSGCCRLVGCRHCLSNIISSCYNQAIIVTKLCISAPPTTDHWVPTIRNEMGKRPVVLFICENGCSWAPTHGRWMYSRLVSISHGVAVKLHIFYLILLTATYFYHQVELKLLCLFYLLLTLLLYFFEKIRNLDRRLISTMMTWTII